MKLKGTWERNERKQKENARQMKETEGILKENEEPFEVYDRQAESRKGYKEPTRRREVKMEVPGAGKHR